jgi:hypothetical protein
MIPVIADGFLLLRAFLLWLVIVGRGVWWVKLSAVVVTCTLPFAVWRVVQRLVSRPSLLELQRRPAQRRSRDIPAHSRT